MSASDKTENTVDKMAGKAKEAVGGATGGRGRMEPRLRGTWVGYPTSAPANTGAGTRRRAAAQGR